MVSHGESESEFSKRVFNMYSPLIDGGLEIKENKNILTDTTCVFEKNQFEFIHGFSETDIAIYKELKFTPKDKELELFKFYGDKDVHRGAISVPYVILELKTGDLTTDGIRSRDFVASRIKSIFPFAAYYLIAENTKKENKTLLRQGKNFTNYFISSSKMDDKYLMTIFERHIRPHIKNLQEQLS